MALENRRNLEPVFHPTNFATNPAPHSGSQAGVQIVAGTMYLDTVYAASPPRRGSS
jgi:hypothetical protein